MDFEITDKKNITLVGISILATIIAVIFFLPLFEYSVDVQESEETQGTVESKNIKVIEGEDSTSYAPVVEYRYSVNSKSYSNDDVFPPTSHRNSYDSRSEAKSVLSSYTRGSNVRVNYRPREPGEAYLEKGDADVYFWWVVVTIVYIVLSIVFAASMVKSGVKRWRQRRWIRDTPTQDIESVAVGPAEIKGTIESKDSPLEAPFTNEDCVYYEYKVEEYKMGTDDRNWETVDEGSEHTPFYVDDGTGKMLVIPDDDATYESESEYKKEVDNDEQKSEINEFIENNPDLSYSDNSRRYKQKIIDDKDSGYVFGTVQIRQNSGDESDQSKRLCIKKVQDESIAEPLFMISNSDEITVIDRRKFALWRVPYGSIFLVISLFMLGVLLSLVIDIPVPVWL